MQLIRKTKLFKCSSYDLHWHGFIKWWSENKDGNISNSNYFEVKYKASKFTVSEYPNGNLVYIHKHDKKFISGIWFYIDGCKIRLIPSE